MNAPHRLPVRPHPRLVPPPGAATEPRLSEPISIAELSQRSTAKALQARQRQADEAASRQMWRRAGKLVLTFAGALAGFAVLAMALRGVS